MQPSGRTVYLVSCVKKKRPQECAARNLYISDLFCKARRYAEASGCPWYIYCPRSMASSRPTK
jgi:hypothetical protein